MVVACITAVPRRLLSSLQLSGRILHYQAVLQHPKQGWITSLRVLISIWISRADRKVFTMEEYSLDYVHIAGHLHRLP